MRAAADTKKNFGHNCDKVNFIYRMAMELRETVVHQDAVVHKERREIEATDMLELRVIQEATDTLEPRESQVHQDMDDQV